MVSIMTLSKHLREYICHCPECEVYQTCHHRPFSSMQPIKAPPVPFHTISIDFILALLKASSGHDTLLVVTCKFSKRVTLIPGLRTWAAKHWAKAIMTWLLDVDWGIPKVVISDQHPKFLAELWVAVVQEMTMTLLYAPTY